MRFFRHRRHLWSIRALAVVALAPFAPEASAQTFTTKGNIPSNLSINTMARLGNGTVLALGSDISAPPGQYVVPASALYDPVSDIWSPAPPLPDRAGGYTATTLPNGKVLVAGGGMVPLPDRGGVKTDVGPALLFDPNTSGWQTTGALTVRRDGHTATLLQDGRVLVVAGLSAAASFNLTTSAELYDPATGTWSSGAPLAVGRFLPRAALLANGKVLVVGGQNGGALKHAELYDPVANTWSPAGQVAVASLVNALNLLPNGKVLNMGLSYDLYDPSTNVWSSAPTPLVPRVGQIASLLPSGRLLIAGGSDASGELASAELYDSASNSWSFTGSLAASRGFHRAVALANGDVLVAGGSGDGFVRRAIEIYSTSAPPVPALSRWGMVALTVALLTLAMTMSRRLGSQPSA